jgi:hypothetical protein
MVQGDDLLLYHHSEGGEQVWPGSRRKQLILVGHRFCIRTASQACHWVQQHDLATVSRQAAERGQLVAARCEPRADYSGLNVQYTRAEAARPKSPSPALDRAARLRNSLCDTDPSYASIQQELVDTFADLLYQVQYETVTVNL